MKVAAPDQAEDVIDSELLTGKLADLRGPVATIVTGRNVDMAVFTRIVSGRDVRLGDLAVKGTPHAA
jgi:threonine dehydratase